MGFRTRECVISLECNSPSADASAAVSGLMHHSRPLGSPRAPPLGQRPPQLPPSTAAPESPEPRTQQTRHQNRLETSSVWENVSLQDQDRDRNQDLSIYFPGKHCFCFIAPYQLWKLKHTLYIEGLGVVAASYPLDRTLNAKANTESRTFSSYMEPKGINMNQCLRYISYHKRVLEPLKKVHKFINKVHRTPK